MLCEFTELRLPVMERVGKPRTCPCVRAACVLVLLTRSIKKILGTAGAQPSVFAASWLGFSLIAGCAPAQ